MDILRPFRTRQPRPRASAPRGTVIYAIGDIHGRADLLDDILVRIEMDHRETAPDLQARLVFLGDYIDRGPASQVVIERLCALRADTRWRTRFVKGNHDAALLAFLEDPETGPQWCSYGGVETLQSYGVRSPAHQSDPDEWRAVQDALALALPSDHRAFFEALEAQVVFGGYAFVHAGVRPGVQLEAQREDDLLNIREPFLSARAPCDKVVVHGHTPERAPHRDENRIGVDTGAYLTGVLTAVRLEGETVRFVQAVLG